MSHLGFTPSPRRAPRLAGALMLACSALGACLPRGARAAAPPGQCVGDSAPSGRGGGGAPAARRARPPPRPGSCSSATATPSAASIR